MVITNKDGDSCLLENMLKFSLNYVFSTINDSFTSFSTHSIPVPTITIVVDKWCLLLAVHDYTQDDLCAFSGQSREKSSKSR